MDHGSTPLPACSEADDDWGARIHAPLFVAVFLDSAAAASLDVRAGAALEARAFADRSAAEEFARARLARHVRADAPLAELRRAAGSRADATVLRAGPVHDGGYRRGDLLGGAQIVLFLKTDISEPLPLDGARACWAPAEMDLADPAELGADCAFVRAVAGELVGGRLFDNHLRFACVSGHVGWCYRPSYLSDDEAPEVAHWPGAPPAEGDVQLRDSQRNWDSLQFILRCLRETYLDPTLRIELVVAGHAARRVLDDAARADAKARQLTRPVTAEPSPAFAPWIGATPLSVASTDTASIASLDGMPPLDLDLGTDEEASDVSLSQDSGESECPSPTEKTACSHGTAGLCDLIFGPAAEAKGYFVSAHAGCDDIKMFGYSSTPRASPVLAEDGTR